MSTVGTIPQTEEDVNFPMALMALMALMANLQVCKSAKRQSGESANQRLCSDLGLQRLADDFDGGANLLGEGLPLDADDLEVGLVDG